MLKVKTVIDGGKDSQTQGYHRWGLEVFGGLLREENCDVESCAVEVGVKDTAGVAQGSGGSDSLGMGIDCCPDWKWVFVYRATAQTALNMIRLKIESHAVLE
jgi:hypothetical protein